MIRLGNLGASSVSMGVQAMVQATAAQMGVDPALALAVAKVESNFNPAAVSSAGAVGVMQLMPATAAQMGVSNPLDPQQNILGGLRYLAMLIGQFAGDVSKALAAYNWGPANVQNAVAARGAAWMSALPMETQNYLISICSLANCPGSPFANPTTTPAPAPAPSDGGSIPNNDYFSASIGPAAAPATGLDTQTIFLLVLGAIGAYIFSDSLLN